VAIGGMLRREDVGPRVLTIVLQLAHDDLNEELRMTAVGPLPLSPPLPLPLARFLPRGPSCHVM
jgi:hypothetical protein